MHRRDLGIQGELGPGDLPITSMLETKGEPASRCKTCRSYRQCRSCPELDDSDLDAICAKCNRYKRMEIGGGLTSVSDGFKWFPRRMPATGHHSGGN